VEEVGGTTQTAGDLAALVVTADAAIDVAVADLANGTDGLGALKTLIDTVNTDLANGTDGLGALKTLIDTLTTTVGAAGAGLTGITGAALSTAGILAIWHQAVSAIVTAGTIGKLLVDEVTAARMAVLTDWINGGRLDLILDIIAADTTTDIPALIATAQADLDIITGSNGVTLAAAQALYAPAKAGDNMGTVSSVTGNVDGNVTGSVGSLVGHTVQTADHTANIALILTDTGTTLDTKIDLLVAAVDTAQGEPGQGAPPASASMDDKIAYLYKAWRNKVTQTATTLSIFDDAGTTVDHKATVSDDTTTATKGEIVTGP